MPLTSPFWLLNGRGKSHYPVEDQSMVNEPESKRNFNCVFKIEINGVAYEVIREVVYKNDDPVLGEVRQNLDLIPPITVKGLKPVFYWPIKMDAKLNLRSWPIWMHKRKNQVANPLGFHGRAGLDRL